METKIISARDKKELSKTGQMQVITEYEFTINQFGPFLHKVPQGEDTVESLRKTVLSKKAIIEADLA